MSMLAPNDSPLRILVVDDNHDAALSLGIMLTVMGYTTLTVYDGEAAVTAADSFRPHVVLLDIGLPKLNGYEVARQIRRREWGASMHLVGISGWGQDEDRDRAAGVGMNQYLVKPIEVQVLEHLLIDLDHRIAT